MLTGGTFYLNGIQVCGFIPGKDILGDACMYVITKKDTSGPDWYLQALEVVLETIEYVLEQPNPDSYRLAWSS